MQTIRQERSRQGLKSRDLAERMHVSPARISVLERDEGRGAVTLNMMRKAAKALNCRLEYSLVPVEPAEQLSRSQSKPRMKVPLESLV